MNYAGWQRVEKDAPMKPFLVVNAFSSRSHHHTVRPRGRGGVVCVADCLFSYFVCCVCFVWLGRDGGEVVISSCT